MKLSIFLILGLSLIVSLTMPAEKISDALTMNKLDGTEVNLSEYLANEGKVTVLYFWATWNKDAITALDNINNDYLEDWQDEYDLKFIAVAMDDSRNQTKVAPFVSSKGWGCDILCNPDQTAYEALGFVDTPYCFLVDTKGNIIYTHSGYKSGDEEDLEDEIRKASE